MTRAATRKRAKAGERAWRNEARWILASVECDICRGFGAEMDGTYPCTKCGGRGRVRKRKPRRSKR